MREFEAACLAEDSAAAAAVAADAVAASDVSPAPGSSGTPHVDGLAASEPVPDITSPLVDLLSAARLVHNTIHGIAAGNVAARSSSVVTRISVDYIGQRRTTPAMSQMSDFLRASVNVDSAFQIQTWDEKDAPAPIFDTSTMRYASTNFRKYIATRLSTFTHFTGNLRVKLSMSAAAFVRAMEPWCTSHGYKIKVMNCQSLHQSKIGFLLYSSSFVDQVALAASIKLHPLWATMGGFEFGLTNERFKSETDNAWCIMIECDKTKMIPAIRFFTALYNDETVRPPLGTQFYFYVTQFNGGNRSTRAELVQIQKTFLLTESKICIGGFGSMDSPMRMRKGTGTVTLRELLMAMRQANNPSATLLYGIDERLFFGEEPLPTRHFFLRFHRDFRQLIYDRLPTLEEDLKTIILPADYHIAVSCVSEGLYHFGGWPLIDPQPNGDDMSVSTAGGNPGNHVLSLIQRSHKGVSTGIPVVPSEIQSTVQRASAWATPPDVGFVHSSVGGSVSGGFSVAAGTVLDFSTPSVVATPDVVMYSERMTVPGAGSTLSPAAFPSLVSSPATASVTTDTVLWQAQNERMQAMEQTALVYRRAVRGVMGELHNQGAKVDSQGAKVDFLATEIGGLKAGQAEVMEYLKHTVNALRSKSNAGSAVDSANEPMSND